ncbi:MAG: hydroxymethylbilane synthase [Deltaproteobacteria bacterium]|nr:MAG: hydroxymethylbilane synthase [Deltaproteobacteria bacterium]
MKSSLVIGTRGSALALWQAEHIRDALRERHPGLNVDLEVISTKGDRVLDRQLSEIGGKGLFIKEIEAALVDRKIDLAVHSLKDMPWAAPDGLELAVIPERASPWDVLCPRDPGHTLHTLPPRARVGTGSLRRITQIRRLRPDLQLVPIRGNVQTRLDKRSADREDLHAVVLAEAGLRRLGIWAQGFQVLRAPDFLPAPGQGALALEIRTDDNDTRGLIAPLECPRTRLCVEAERAALHGVEGDCHTPFAAWADLDGDVVTLHARLLDESGRATEARDSGPVGKGAAAVAVARSMGAAVARNIVRQHTTGP